MTSPERIPNKIPFGKPFATMNQLLSTETPSEPFQSEYIRLEIRGHILYSYYKMGKVITLDVAKEIVHQRVHFMKIGRAHV